MADPLALTTYAIQRQFKTGGLALSFMDGEGNQVLKSQGRVLVTQQPIETMDGALLATVTHKLVAITPEYDLHEGGSDGKVISVVKVPMQLISGMGTLGEVDIKDVNGNKIAVANGNFLGMEFSVRDSQGTAVATVTRNLGTNAGLLNKFANFMSESYVMNITATDKVPTLVLLGFLVALELLISKGQASSPGLVNMGPMGPGGIGGFGVGKGGFGVKL